MRIICLKITAIFMILTAFLICHGPAHAAVSYKLTDLGTLGGSLNSTQAWDLNNNGQIVGRGYNSLSSPVYTDFLWSGGSLKSLNVTGTSNGIVGINDEGQVVGDGFNGSHAFIRDSNGAMLDLGVLAGGSSSSANGINNAGQVVGISDVLISGVMQLHAFLWNATGGMQDLGSMGGLSTARRINEAGQVVGYYVDSGGKQHACLWSGTADVKDLGIAGGGSRANGINDEGQVVGQSKDGYGAFLWNASNGVTDLPALVTSERIYAYDISNSGQIVGYGGGGSRMGDRAVIWNFDSDGSVTAVDLNTLCPVDGWILGAATTINDKGEIAGFMRQANGPATHAFLLTPVPLPPVLYLFGSGLAVLGFLRRRYFGGQGVLVCRRG
jgi:probable HAF family extracellular repeat protein